MRPIDADAVLKKVLSIHPYCGHCDGYGFVQLDVVEDSIKDAPTIEAEPVKHGFNVKQKACGDDAFECSICGYEDWDCMTCEPKHHNYCPNCGAKMDLED